MSRKKIEEPNEDIPAWVVSFTDMITLLLAFFVLLQAFAQEQSAEMFHEGQGSFKQAIAGFGMPMWQKGRDKRVKRDWFTKRHSDKPDPNNKDNTTVTDAEEEKLQKIFQELKENLDSDSANVEQKPIRIEAMPITFSSHSSSLNGKARRCLDELAVNLRNNLPPEGSSVYMVGLAPDQKSSQKTWVLSARRAQSAGTYLQKKLNENSRNWKIITWGGGQQFGRFPQGTYIGMVVMGADHGR